MKVPKEVALKGRITPDCSGVIFTNSVLAQTQLSPKGGVDVDVTLIFGKVPRTLAQNRYLWGVVYPTMQRELLEITGEYFTPEELHMFNLQKIQGTKMEFKTIAGEEVMYIKDKKSSKMTVEEFGEMVEKVILFCSENWGFTIPPPVGDNSLDNIFNLVR
jgi:hypothetical protein